jgi:outer membrane lipoprotein-sorting protein
MFRTIVVLSLAATAGSAWGQTLEATFARMDSVAATFKGLTASLKQVKHTAVINEDETDIGKITVKRSTRKDLRTLIEFLSPAPKKAFVGGNKAQIYYPATNLVQEWDLGKSATIRDELMMLAFGSNSREISSAYSVSLGGADTLAGQKATRIVLIPKNKDLLNLFPKIELWISDETGLTLQQKLYDGRGGDYVLATYTDIKLTNPSDSAVKLDIPKNAKIERPQK